MSTVTLGRTFLFALLPLCLLTAMTPVPDCHGCVAVPVSNSTTGPQGGWDLTVHMGVTSGACDPSDGDPQSCVAESCQSTILVTGTGPASTQFDVCYLQTGYPKYCINTPVAPSTDANGNVNFTTSKRTGCGNEMRWEAAGPAGQSRAIAVMYCSECLP